MLGPSLLFYLVTRLPLFLPQIFLFFFFLYLAELLERGWAAAIATRFSFKTNKTN